MYIYKYKRLVIRWHRLGAFDARSIQKMGQFKVFDQSALNFFIKYSLIHSDVLCFNILSIRVPRNLGFVILLVLVTNK